MAYCDFLAGMFGGACNLFISHPLDTIKTNMQSSNLRFTTAAVALIKADGMKSYYRGLLFPLCSTGLLNSIVFGVYGNSFRLMQDHTKDSDTKQKLWYKHIFLAGCFGGVFKAIVACPIELTKVRLQVRVNDSTRPSLVIKNIIVTEGIKGAFRGLTPMLWRDAIPYGIFMWVYELTLEKLRNEQTDYHYKATDINSMHTAIAGGVAGIMSWLPAIPFDVVKTKMMTEIGDHSRYRNLWHCAQLIIQESGWTSLFRGGSVLLLRSAPVCAVQFLGYEYMLRYCQQNSFLPKNNNNNKQFNTTLAANATHKSPPNS